MLNSDSHFRINLKKYLAFLDKLFISRKRTDEYLPGLIKKKQQLVVGT